MQVRARFARPCSAAVVEDIDVMHVDRVKSDMLRFEELLCGEAPDSDAARCSSKVRSSTFVGVAVIALGISL